MSGLSGGTAYVDVALGKTDDLKRGIQAAGGDAADTAKQSFLGRVGSIAMGGALGGALTAGVSKAFELGKGAIFDFNSQLQQASIGFTTMLGSSKAAGDYVGQLQQFAKTTPFEFGNLVQNAQQMMGMGIASRDVIPDLTALGDSVASIGGSASQVDSVTLAFDQMNAKGTLDMGNMNQLMQNGVPSALKVLAAHYKVTTGEMITMISAGKVQASEALPALVSGIEKGTDATAALGGMMDKQSHTMAGALSNIKDSAVQNIAGAFKPIFDGASSAAQGLANMLGSDALANGSKKISGFLTKGFTAASDSLSNLKYGWKEADSVISEGGSTGLVAIGAHVSQGFDKARDAVGKFGPVVKEAFLDRVAMVKQVVGDAVPIVERLADRVGPVLGKVFRAAGDLLFQHVFPALEKISTFVREQVIPAVMDFVSFAADHVVPIFIAVGEVISQKVMPIVGHLVDLFVQKVLPTLAPLIKDGFGLLKEVISGLTPIVIDLVHWFADYALPVISDLASFIIGQLIPTVLQVADILIKILRPAFEIAIAIVRDVLVPIFEVAAGVFLGLEDAGIHMASAVVTAVHGVAAAVVWVKDRLGDLVGWFADLPGKFAKAGSTMWDWIKSSFKSAINTVINWWDGLKFTLPTVHIPGTGDHVGGGEIGVPTIKPLAAGGLVLPSPGGTVVRVAEAGAAEIVAPEAAIQAAVTRALASGRVGRDGPLAVFNYSGPQAPTPEMQAAMMRELAWATS